MRTQEQVELDLFGEDICKSPAPQCVFNHITEAVARYFFSDGCLCFPDPGIQELCAHHEYNATPYGSMILLGRYEHVGPQMVWSRG